MPQLSQPTKRLIQKYKNWYRLLQPKEGISVIHVDEVASRVASFYEKIRGVVEWKEEHLLRRTAIERKLKRRLLTRKNGERIAEALVLELIRGGHFPNDRIPESKIIDVQKSIDKYIYILKNTPFLHAEKQKLQFLNWLIGIAACEIENILAPSIKEMALIDYMTDIMKERIKLNQGAFTIRGINKEEKDIQIYIAVQRALFKLDSPIITYHLLEKIYPKWNNLSGADLESVTAKIQSIREKIKKDLSHRLADKFYNICEKYDTPYLLLGDIISKNPINAEEKLTQGTSLESSIRKAYNKRLKALKARLTRAAVFATLSVFITKVSLFLAIEIPIDKYITKQFNPLAVGIDILVPTLLMAFLVTTVRPPKRGNLEQAILEVTKIIYKKERKEIYEIKIKKRQSVATRIIILVLYALSFCLSVWVIFLVLRKINFPLLSYLIFIIFLSLIAFAGMRIRERAKELQITERKRGFIAFLLDFFSLPLIHLGKSLSREWEKHNFLITIINSLIDMPFQVFVEFLEQWREFLKEKKEEIH